jgi:hypothetical protein
LISAIAADAARNQANNALTNIGHGVASTGAAVTTNVESMVPLAAFSHYGPGSTPLAVNHDGLFVATTISSNLAPSASLGDAVDAINQAMDRIGVPSSIHGSFQGTAPVFQQSIANEPFLIVTALVAVYIVLGSSTKATSTRSRSLSTLPSAGVGAVLALMAFKTEFSIIALIGVILLIGIVKKNAIMMIDFALEAERSHGLHSREAIFQACLLRFRPIMTTTMAAMLGAVPLAMGLGDGGELRRPLGISIVGGLIVSQLLTLYTTPVIYLVPRSISALVPKQLGLFRSATSRERRRSRARRMSVFEARQTGLLTVSKTWTPIRALGDGKKLRRHVDSQGPQSRTHSRGCATNWSRYRDIEIAPRRVRCANGTMAPRMLRSSRFRAVTWRNCRPQA